MPSFPTQSELSKKKPLKPTASAPAAAESAPLAASEPIVVERIVEKIVEKPVEKIVEKIVYKDRGSSATHLTPHEMEVMKRLDAEQETAVARSRCAKLEVKLLDKEDEIQKLNDNIDTLSLQVSTLNQALKKVEAQKRKDARADAKKAIGEGADLEKLLESVRAGRSEIGRTIRARSGKSATDKMAYDDATGEIFWENGSEDSESGSEVGI